jgi:transcriptional regulator with XRE-family HTH domain
MHLYCNINLTLNMKHIGKNIRSLRQKLGWSQADAANRLRISIPAFSKIETSITDINLSRLAQIAELFDVSVSDILAKPGETLGKTFEKELKICQEKLAASEQNVNRLQSRVIDLFDEVRMYQSNLTIPR